MKEYEFIKELFNNCSGMATTYVEEIETDDPETFLHTEKYITKDSKYTKSVQSTGIVFEVVTSGLKRRYTFTEF